MRTKLLGSTGRRCVNQNFMKDGFQKHPSFQPSRVGQARLENSLQPKLFDGSGL